MGVSWIIRVRVWLGLGLVVLVGWCSVAICLIIVKSLNPVYGTIALQTA